LEKSGDRDESLDLLEKSTKRGVTSLKSIEVSEKAEKSKKIKRTLYDIIGKQKRVEKKRGRNPETERSRNRF